MGGWESACARRSPTLERPSRFRFLCFLACAHNPRHVCCRRCLQSVGAQASDAKHCRNDFDFVFCQYYYSFSSEREQKKTFKILVKDLASIKHRCHARRVGCARGALCFPGVGIHPSLAESRFYVRPAFASLALDGGLILPSSDAAGIAVVLLCTYENEPLTGIVFSSMWPSSV